MRWLLALWLFGVGLSISSPAVAACPIPLVPGPHGCVQPAGSVPEWKSRDPKWHGTWGAVAAHGKGAGWGTSVNSRSKRAAGKAALKECETLVPAGKCTIVAVYQGCIVIAGLETNPVDTMWGNHENYESAVQIATQGCEKEYGGNCKVVHWDCNQPVYE